MNMVQNEETVFILRQLREVAFQIEQKHRLYKRTQDRNTKYGSLWVFFQFFFQSSVVKQAIKK